MTTVFFYPNSESEPSKIELLEGESILDGALRSGLDLPFGCRNGVCHSCIVKATEGSPTAESQSGLSEPQKIRDYFLACSCIPKTPITFSKIDLTNEITQSKVLEILQLNDTVFRLRLEKNIDFRPGQFATLWRDEHVARSYSIASQSSLDAFLEFHIKRVPGGAFSEWALENLNPGDQVGVQGPLGECFYNSTNKDQTLFLSGIGTGLAPLYGILRDAIENQHSGPIKLLVGAKSASNFYYQNELKQIALNHKNVHIDFISQSPTEATDCVSGDIYAYSKSFVEEFKGIKVFLCGAESFVKKMKKQCFLAGANMQDIHSDPFIAFNSN